MDFAFGYISRVDLAFWNIIEHPFCSKELKVLKTGSDARERIEQRGIWIGDVLDEQIERILAGT